MRGGNAFTDIPVYVLVDEFTASASEIVSGALQDHERATLVGTTTFGKGLVQTVVDLSNGGALKVTTAVYLTPDGTDINKKGIAPDVTAPDLDVDARRRRDARQDALADRRGNEVGAAVRRGFRPRFFVDPARWPTPAARPAPGAVGLRRPPCAQCAARAPRRPLRGRAACPAETRRRLRCSRRRRACSRLPTSPWSAARSSWNSTRFPSRRPPTACGSCSVRRCRSPATSTRSSRRAPRWASPRSCCSRPTARPARPPTGCGERLPRWERIAREAAKQSKQSAVPSVVVVASLDAALALVVGATAGSRWCCEPSGALDVAAALSAACPGAVAAGGLALWVGPEGGWSEGELVAVRCVPRRSTRDAGAARPAHRDGGPGGGGAGPLRRRRLVDREFPSRPSRGTLAAMVPIADWEGEPCRSCVSICGPRAAEIRRTR